MSFLSKWNKSFAKDKRIHFGIGIIAGYTFYFFEYFFTGLGAIITLCIIQATAYGIEFYQSFEKSRQVEALDAFSVVAGGTLVVTLSLIFVEVAF